MENARRKRRLQVPTERFKCRFEGPGIIYYLQCIFVKQKSAQKNDGNRILHFLWIKNVYLNVLYIS